MDGWSENGLYCKFLKDQGIYFITYLHSKGYFTNNLTRLDVSICIASYAAVLSHLPFKPKCITKVKGKS